MLTRPARRLSTAALAAVAGLAVLTPMAHAADADAAAKKPAKVTVAGYTKYLQTQKTPAAKKTLKKFSALNKAQKARFVKHLNNRYIYEALTDQVKGSIGRPLYVVDPYNKDVRFITDVTSKVGKDKNHTTTVSFTMTEEIFKIPVTSERIKLTFQRTGKPGKKATAAAKATNVNAAINIKAGRVAVKGNAAKISWAATPRVKAFGKKLAKTQSVASAQGYYKANLENR
ncbi:hypothetical protein AB0K49_29870 [Streptomyces decoyicus]|uniref:hypothetical protein n=1 Tax=Streptomyces decoyicus TaxID=249567 RepID=UPI00345D72DA